MPIQKKDFTKEIIGYALKNALDYGKADASKILPKLFQHGLQKEQIPQVMPQIQQAVEDANNASDEERILTLEKYLPKLKQHKEEERKLPPLPNPKNKMVFRLAPYPSGALHIGNAKTYMLNAIYAEHYKGKTLLVMDDTIGSEAKHLVKESYNLIKEAFKWLGVKYEEPIIYKSDRLEIYYEYAEKLINKDKAYVCHCTQEKMQDHRKKGIACGCRELPPNIQLARWKHMFEQRPGEATLRIKTDMMHPNPAFRDRVLFKISDRPHPRRGKKYTVWPSLEMTWAIDDHELGITHIIRGNDLMMETEMEKFMWDIFKWKHSETAHVGLVRISGMDAKVSKSKAQKEVLSGELSGWDDPRTWSIQSLKRRGFTKQSIRDFVEEIGLNKQDITIPIENFYATNRKLIDSKANRFFFVKDPVELTFTEKLPTHTEIPIHPDKPDKTRKIKLSKKISISQEDFKKYKGKEVRLLHLFNIEFDSSGKATITSKENKDIPKIQWVAKPVNTRILMPDGKWTLGVAEPAIQELKVNDIIQFERFGFVRFDTEHRKVQEFWFAHK